MKEYEFKKDKLIDIQEKYELLVNSTPSLSNLAKTAYNEYLSSYLYKKINDKYNMIEELDQEKIAKSFGLKKPPQSRIRNFNKKGI